MTKHYNTSVIVGRFQTPSIDIHPGYKALFDKAFEVSDRVLILVGASHRDGETSRNPFDHRLRSFLVLDYFERNFYNFPVLIYPIWDTPSDKLWLDYLYLRIKQFCLLPEEKVVFLTGRDSFLSRYKPDEILYPVENIGDNSGISSSEIRETHSIVLDPTTGPAFMQGWLECLRHNKL